MSIQEVKTDSIPPNLDEGSVTWQSPSNIALIKYWGKHGRQLPKNPSISFTLSEATSKTSISYRLCTADDSPFAVEFYFGNQKNIEFGARIKQYLQNLSDQMPFLARYHFVIRSSNTFPHSAGIASSASAFSALALGLCSIESQLYANAAAESVFMKRASLLARLGSGSACRSVYAFAALWGQTEMLANSSDQYAIPMESHIHPVFKTYQDSILIISREKKQVSSSVGHDLMERHPYAKTRYQEANRNLNQMLHCLQNGDQEQMGIICEMEAMQLHALMLCSDPNYILLQPNTLRAISSIQAFRKETSLPVYFTLDAGPNVHLLYPLECKMEVQKLIINELVGLCDQGQWIDDKVGTGPLKINVTDQHG
jgi:diphosphomevalonate decarboxylase